VFHDSKRRASAIPTSGPLLAFDLGAILGICYCKISLPERGGKEKNWRYCFRESHSLWRYGCHATTALHDERDLSCCCSYLLRVMKPCITPCMGRLRIYVSHLLRRRPICGVGSMYLSHQLLLDDVAPIPNLISLQLLDYCTSRVSTNDPVTKARNSQTLFSH